MLCKHGRSPSVSPVLDESLHPPRQKASISCAFVRRTGSIQFVIALRRFIMALSLAACTVDLCAPSWHRNGVGFQTVSLKAYTVTVL